jgi:hypothetical protein
MKKVLSMLIISGILCLSACGQKGPLKREQQVFRIEAGHLLAKQ